MKYIQKPPGGVSHHGAEGAPRFNREAPATYHVGRWKRKRHGLEPRNAQLALQPSLTTGLWEDGGNAEIKVAT